MKKKICILALAAAMLSGCSSGNTSDSVSLRAMNTYMTLTAYGSKAAAANIDAKNEIKRLDTLLSSEDPDSEISQLNAHGTYQLEDDAYALVKRAIQIGDETDGALDITILPILKLWGFTDDSLHVPTEEELDEALEKVDYSRIQTGADNQVTLMDGQSITLGAIAKGYTSDRVREIYESYGISSAIISLGGNVCAIGSKPDGSAWRVGIMRPDIDSVETDYFCVLQVKDLSVITSGGYERYLTDDEGNVYQHIFDPSNGYPVSNGLKSVTIVSADGALADALSTALYVKGLEGAEEYWKNSADLFDMVLVTDDNSIYITEGIQDIYSSKEEYTVIKR